MVEIFEISEQDEIRNATSLDMQTMVKASESSIITDYYLWKNRRYVIHLSK